MYCVQTRGMCHRIRTRTKVGSLRIGNAMRKCGKEMTDQPMPRKEWSDSWFIFLWRKGLDRLLLILLLARLFAHRLRVRIRWSGREAIRRHQMEHLAPLRFIPRANGGDERDSHKKNLGNAKGHSGWCLQDSSVTLPFPRWLHNFGFHSAGNPVSDLHVT